LGKNGVIGNRKAKNRKIIDNKRLIDYNIYKIKIIKYDKLLFIL